MVVDSLLNLKNINVTYWLTNINSSNTPQAKDSLKSLKATDQFCLEHTMSSRNIADVSINGISLPGAGINALIAGCYNVPAVFVAGELALCQQAKALFGEVETVATKEGFGNAALCLHPEVVREQIREGVQRALTNLTKYKPYKLRSPYKLVLKLKNEELVHQKSFYPGADWELTYESPDLLEIMKAFAWMH